MILALLKFINSSFTGFGIKPCTKNFPFYRLGIKPRIFKTYTHLARPAKSGFFHAPPKYTFPFPLRSHSKENFGGTLGKSNNAPLHFLPKTCIGCYTCGLSSQTITLLLLFHFTGFGIKPCIYYSSHLARPAQSGFFHTPPKLTLPNPPAHHKDTQRQFRRDFGQEYYYTCITKFSILRASASNRAFSNLYINYRFKR